MSTTTRGARVHLRPIMAHDHDLLRLAELSAEDGVTFRHRGTTPGADDFVASISRGVLSQFMVCANDHDRPLGHVTAYNHDFRNGHSYVAAFLFSEYRAVAWPLEGMKLFLDYLFDVFPFHKLYAEALDVNVERFASLPREIWREEARLKEREYFEGAFIDKLIFALDREPWLAWSAEMSSSARRSKLLDALRSRSVSSSS